MTASQDGLIKLWDRRQLSTVASLASTAGGFGKSPFFSVAASENLICGGTNEDLLFWDIRSLTKSIGRFTEGHNDDVTQLAFSEDQSLLISCSVDNVLNMFDFSSKVGACLDPKAKLQEDDLIDGAYSSS